MRTTLTLEDDVCAHLVRLQKTRKIAWKALVNEALRKGLMQLDQPEPESAFRQQLFDCGDCLIGDFRSTSEALRLGEGEDYR